MSFADEHPLSWTFHRATSRWAFNSLAPSDDCVPTPGREDPSRRWLALPRALPPAASLAAALAERRSCRDFSTRDLTLADMASLCALGFGIKGYSRLGAHELPERTFPSGGGLYPLELSLLVRAVAGCDPGVYHYVPVTHGLEHVRDGALPRDLLQYLFMGQPYAADAAVVFVLSAVFDRNLRKYGARGYRYLLMEAGHVGQNLSLLAAGMGLGACCLGGFFDVELSSLLRLDLAEEGAVYAIAVGHPRENGDAPKLA